VLYQVSRRGRVTVEAIEVGPLASVATVLAHREVVRQLRRYEGLSGRLVELWDRYVLGLADQAGRFNPFPAGSEAFEAWHELRKLPDLIQIRLASLGEGGIPRHAEAALRAEVEILAEELAHYRRVVEAAATQPGRGLIAAPDLSKLRRHYPSIDEVVGRTDLGPVRDDVVRLVDRAHFSGEIDHNSIGELVGRMARARSSKGVDEVLAELRHALDVGSSLPAGGAGSPRVFTGIKENRLPEVRRALGLDESFTLEPLTEIDALYKIGDVIHIDSVKHTPRALRRVVDDGSDHLKSLGKWASDDANRRVRVVVDSEADWATLVLAKKGDKSVISKLAEEDIPLRLAGRDFSVNRLDELDKLLTDAFARAHVDKNYGAALEKALEGLDETLGFLGFSP
jgi:hypothetical protein